MSIDLETRGRLREAISEFIYDPRSQGDVEALIDGLVIVVDRVVDWPMPKPPPYPADDEGQEQPHDA